MLKKTGRAGDRDGWGTCENCPPSLIGPSVPSWSGGQACEHPPTTPWNKNDTEADPGWAAIRFPPTRGSCLHRQESEDTIDRALNILENWESPLQTSRNGMEFCVLWCLSLRHYYKTGKYVMSRNEWFFRHWAGQGSDMPFYHNIVSVPFRYFVCLKDYYQFYDVMMSNKACDDQRQLTWSQLNSFCSFYGRCRKKWKGKRDREKEKERELQGEGGITRGCMFAWACVRIRYRTEWRQSRGRVQWRDRRVLLVRISWKNITSKQILRE